MPILKEDDRNIKNFRISLADKTGIVIKDALSLLGIEVPERM
jgi:arginyl-tRNA synthetase